MNDILARLDGLDEREKELLQSGDTSSDSVYELSQIRAERELLRIRREQIKIEEEEGREIAARRNAQARIDALEARARQILKDRPKHLKRAMERLDAFLADAREVLLAPYRLRAIATVVALEAERHALKAPSLPSLPTDPHDQRRLHEAGVAVAGLETTGVNGNLAAGRLRSVRPERYESNRQLVLDFIG